MRPRARPPRRPRAASRRPRAAIALCRSVARLACAASRSRSAATTRRALGANRRTVARPIPDPAPVTTATFPSKRPMAGSVARMRTARVIHCVDAHAEGEPSRIIVGGVLDVPGTTMLEKARWLEREGDWLRRLCLFEPRGSAPLSADLVLPSSRPEADAGFIIMESSSYEGMSGTNTINTAAVLLETGMVPLVEPETRMVARGAGGPGARARRAVPAGGSTSITFENVPSFCTALDAVGRGAGRRHAAGGCRLRRRVVRVRGRGGARVLDRARRGAGAGRAGRADPPARRGAARDRAPARARRSATSRSSSSSRRRGSGGDARHATIVSPGRLDRSPTGTATSARIAVLDARGTMGDAYVAESVIDTRFSGRVVGRAKVGDARRGRAGDHRPRLDHRASTSSSSTRPTRSRTASSSRTPGAPAASRARSTPERRDGDGHRHALAGRRVGDRGARWGPSATSGVTSSSSSVNSRSRSSPASPSSACSRSRFSGCTRRQLELAAGGARSA